MTDAERAALLEQLRDLDAAQAKIAEARKPFDAATSAIEGVKEALLERHEAEIAGRCETCDRLLFYGDRGHRCDDGPIVCEEHAPTWADIKEEWTCAVDPDPDDLREALADVEAHVAGGGSLEDKVIHEL